MASLETSVDSLSPLTGLLIFSPIETLNICFSCSLISCFNQGFFLFQLLIFSLIVKINFICHLTCLLLFLKKFRVHSTVNLSQNINNLDEIRTDQRDYIIAVILLFI